MKLKGQEPEWANQKLSVGNCLLYHIVEIFHKHKISPCQPIYETHFFFKDWGRETN